jgi:CheY-like chemotaxis protein
VVYGIARQAGGFVAVESAPGQGSTFRIGFPRASAAAGGRRAAERPAPRAAPAGGTVLVAEDEETLRAAVVHALAGVGFEVLQGGTAEAALEAARAHPGEIDLLVTDVVMPGQNGGQLAQALRRERPGVKVLFMTGFPGDPRVAAVLAGVEAGGVLHKPFKHSTLVEQVRRLVAG